MFFEEAISKELGSPTLIELVFSSFFNPLINVYKEVFIPLGFSNDSVDKSINLLSILPSKDKVWSFNFEDLLIEVKIYT